MVRWRRVTVASSLMVVALQGCTTLVDRPETALELTPRDFTTVPEQDQHLDIVQVPTDVFAPHESTSDVTTTSVGGVETITTQKSIVEKNSDGSTRSVDVGAPTEQIRLRVGDKWTIDSLVGQINGRPVYASKFMQSIEDRILRIVAENPRPRARRLIEELVFERFDQYINNELIIAEAEGMISPEMQAGIFNWLQGLQEQTVAGYGGNRASASASLQDQFGMTMEQYLREKRDEALAQDLLRRRVKPRTIVSWRDVERRYGVLEKDYNPQPHITIGRIRLTPSDELLIADVESRLARGETFAQVAAALTLPDGGAWQQCQLPVNGMDGLELAQDIRTALGAVAQGSVTAPIRKPTSVTWYCVMEVLQQAQPSIFDSMLQRKLRRDLEDKRGRYEQFRYLKSLRARWVTNDIDQMTHRLTTIAEDRYLPRE